MANDPLKFPGQAAPDAASQVSDLIAQRAFHEVAERRITDEIWDLIAKYVERDARCGAPAMMALPTVTVQVWLGLWHALDALSPGAVERFDNLRKVMLHQMDIARDIIASKAPDTVAETYGIRIAPEDAHQKPTIG